MQLRVLAFAQARDLLGFDAMEIETRADETVEEVLRRIPRLERLSNLRIALDQEYVDRGQVVGEASELAIIPPVSGG